MMNRNKRMEALNNAGVDTSKYFTVNLPEGIKPGATISLVINENGQPVVINEKKNDVIANQIIADGYVRNSKLHRRFVMAQMFQMLNYVSYDGTGSGYNAYLRKLYDYKYTFNMMLEEVRVLGKLEERDEESFRERSHFFTSEVIANVITDYMEKLEDYIDQLPTKRCKGIPYKHVKGMDIFVADLNKKIYEPLRDCIFAIKYARNYSQRYRLLNNFMFKMIKLPSDTPKSKAWIDAYKGEGAYYTMKNLLMFHNCFVEVENTGLKLYGTKAVSYISSKLDEYKGEGWRMFALMKKVIAINNFDYGARMHELGVKGY